MFVWIQLLALLSALFEGFRSKQVAFLLEENRVYRRLLGDVTPRLTQAEGISLARTGYPLGGELHQLLTLVKPATLLKWHRELIAMKWTFQRKPNGRPPVDSEVENLVLRLADENPRWGCRRLAGALSNLDHQVSHQTIANILTRHSLPTSPQRSKSGPSWKSFLESHADILWATDFFNVEVWTAFGLRTMHVLFFIHLASRRVVIGGVTDHPHQAWMQQIVRNLTGFDGPLEQAKTIIHDRDGKYCEGFKRQFQLAGIETLALPARSPNLNAYAERWVRSVKRECLDHLILLGERQLRYVLSEYVDHYNQERNHQGLGNVIPFPDARVVETPQLDAKITRSPRLGGLLNFYHAEVQAAA